MTTKEIEARITEYKELQRMKEEIEAEMEAIKDELKAEFERQHTDTITTLTHKVTFKEVESNRVDTVALKKEKPEIAKTYTKVVKSKRFTIN